MARDFVHGAIPLDGSRPRSASRKDSTLDHDQNPGRKTDLLAYRSVRARGDIRGDQASPIGLDFDLTKFYKMIFYNSYIIISHFS